MSRHVLNTFVSALVSKATVCVPSPSVDGVRPRSCDEVGLLVAAHTLLHDTSLAFFVSCGVKRARSLVLASGHPRQRRCQIAQLYSTSQVAVMARMRGW